MYNIEVSVNHIDIEQGDENCLQSFVDYVNSGELLFLDEDMCSKQLMELIYKIDPYFIPTLVKYSPELIYIVPDYLHTPRLCLNAIKKSWSEDIFNTIAIPIEGSILKEINKLKLLNGTMEPATNRGIPSDLLILNINDMKYHAMYVLSLMKALGAILKNPSVNINSRIKR